MKPRPPLSTKAQGGHYLKMGSPGPSTDETAHLKRPHTGQKHPAPVNTHFSLLGSEGLGASQLSASLPKVCFAVPPGVWYHNILILIFLKTKARKDQS